MEPQPEATPYLQESLIREHRPMGREYRVLALESPAIARATQPGQFLHVRIRQAPECILRRPFSVYRATQTRVSFLYKVVGRGTRALAELKPGDRLDVLGPLGRGFPMNRAGTFPVLVGGGYGVAPLVFLASRFRSPGVAFVGGATASDLLCLGDFRRLGWPCQVSTEDGSRGTRGVVTDLLDAWLRQHRETVPEFYACGPDGLLQAVAVRAAAKGRTAWVSLARHMGCGLGACLSCVVRVRDSKGRERWARVCRDGPVFEARQVVWSTLGHRSET